MLGGDLLSLFVEPLERLGLDYMVTGSVASMLYGEPRLTNDVDLVLDLPPSDAPRLRAAFSSSDFYCPPEDEIRLEAERATRGHINILHIPTALEADIYFAGDDWLHRWALPRCHRLEVETRSIRLAPPEYVIVRNVVPDEIYNLGAQSHVGISFETPEYTTDVTAVGAVRLLDAIRDVGLHPLFYQASSSEMFGKVAETPQRETTPFHPVREFCERSFACAGITLAWEGEGVDEIGRCTKTGKILVHVDQHYFRPAEVDFLLGDPSKGKRLLGWEPKVTFEGLVEMMTKADLDLAAIESGPRTRN